MLPVEVVPFGLACCRRSLSRLGYPATPRQMDGKLFVSDNGNYVLDCKTPLLQSPPAFEQMIEAIPGVVGTGRFLGMAHMVLVDRGGRIEVRNRPAS